MTEEVPPLRGDQTRPSGAQRVILNHPKVADIAAYRDSIAIGLVQVVGVIADVNSAADLRDAFPDAELFVKEDLTRRGASGTFHGADLRHLTPEVLTDVSWAEPLAMEMMGRLGLIHLNSFAHRRNLFLYLVAFWSEAVARLDATLLYSRYTPHEVVDFVLFAVMRSSGKYTLQFSWTSLLGRWFLTDGYASPRSVFAYPEISTPVSEVRRELDRLTSRVKGDYAAAVPGDLKAGVQRDSWSPLRERLVTFSALARRAPQAVMTIAQDRPVDGGIKAATGKAVSLLGDWAQISAAYRALEGHYNKLATAPDWRTPYVYFALGYQPENTNCPEGGLFGNQLLAIALLSRWLPPGWRIVVKEHPGQLLRSGRGASDYGFLGRSPEFYDAIASLPNAVLAPMHLNPFQLLDQASAAATVTGTVGWEALVRGKPVFCFGDVWYQTAPGCVRVRSSDDAAVGIAQLDHRELRVDEQRLSDFLERIYRVTHPIIFDELIEEATGGSATPNDARAYAHLIGAYFRGELVECGGF